MEPEGRRIYATNTLFRTLSFVEILLNVSAQNFQLDDFIETRFFLGRTDGFGEIGQGTTLLGKVGMLGANQTLLGLLNHIEKLRQEV